MVSTKKSQKSYKENARRASNTNDSDGMVTRHYTRTIPSVLRDVPLLEKSMVDIREKWRTISVGKNIKEADFSNIRAAVICAEKLVSQLKAVKQELLPRMGHIVCPAENSSESSFVLFCSSVAAAVTVGAGGGEVVQEELTRVSKLAACVWMWSLCMATVMNDIELISSSLSLIASHCIFEGLSAGKEEITTKSFESYVFFYGEIEDHRFCLSDEDVSLACELLYNLFTGDDAAAEVSLRRVVSAIDVSEERDDDSVCRGCFFTIMTQLAKCIASEDYYALKLCMNTCLCAGDERQFELPPLVVFFIQTMFDVVVYRRLLQSGVHSAWRPLVDIQMPELNNTSATTTLSSLVHLRAKGPVILSAFLRRWAEREKSSCLVVCHYLQRGSLPSHRPWPFPSAFVEGWLCDET